MLGIAKIIEKTITGIPVAQERNCSLTPLSVLYKGSALKKASMPRPKPANKHCRICAISLHLLLP